MRRLGYFITWLINRSPRIKIFWQLRGKKAVVWAKLNELKLQWSGVAFRGARWNESKRIHPTCEFTAAKQHCCVVAHALIIFAFVSRSLISRSRRKTNAKTIFIKSTMRSLPPNTSTTNHYIIIGKQTEFLIRKTKQSEEK